MRCGWAAFAELCRSNTKDPGYGLYPGLIFLGYFQELLPQSFAAADAGCPIKAADAGCLNKAADAGCLNKAADAG